MPILPLVLNGGQIERLSGRLTQVIITAGATIKAGQPIAIDFITSKGILADSSGYLIAGLAVHDAVDNDPLELATSGILTLADWTDATSGVFLYGQEWFLGPTPGVMLTSVPSAGYAIGTGRFISLSAFEINISQPIKIR